jgi:hypothetical protein
VGKVVNLGIASAPNKSTLAYANEHRPAALSADLFCRSLEHIRDNGGLGQRRRAFRFKSKARWSFSNMASMLRLDRFTYRDLLEWLHSPFSPDPLVPVAVPRRNCRCPVLDRRRHENQGASF